MMRPLSSKIGETWELYIFFIMISVTCQIHKQMRDFLPLKEDMQDPICKECLKHHSGQNSNIQFIQLNRYSISFFLQFTKYLIQKLQTLIQSIRLKGYSTVFRAGGEYSRFSFPTHTECLLNQSCINVLMHYKAILEGNHNYVDENVRKIENLYNSSFLNDLRALFSMSWEIKARSLASDIHSNLIKSLPYMTSITNIPFLFRQEIIKQVQQSRKKMKMQITSQSLKQLKDEVSPSQIKVQQQVRSLSQSLLLVQSFQQILSCEWDSDMKQILQQSVQTLSPNFLSREDLEHQLQEMLLESERLRQENYRLRFQNCQLEDQNASLRSRLAQNIFQ